MSKILVVDDEESIRNLVRMNLELDGHSTLMAEDGQTALEIFERESPEIVLLDVRMPGMDGIEVLKRMKAASPDSEVIIVTGHGDMDMAVECLRKEASNFLTKPVSDDLLSLAVKRAEEKIALKNKLKQYTRNLETLVREANLELERAYLTLAYQRCRSPIAQPETAGPCNLPAFIHLRLDPGEQFNRAAHPAVGTVADPDCLL